MLPCQQKKLLQQQSEHKNIASIIGYVLLFHVIIIFCAFFIRASEEPLLAGFGGRSRGSFIAEFQSSKLSASGSGRLATAHKKTELSKATNTKSVASIVKSAKTIDPVVPVVKKAENNKKDIKEKVVKEKITEKITKSKTPDAAKAEKIITVPASNKSVAKLDKPEKINLKEKATEPKILVPEKIVKKVDSKKVEPKADLSKPEPKLETKVEKKVIQKITEEKKAEPKLAQKTEQKTAQKSEQKIEVKKTNQAETYSQNSSSTNNSSKTEASQVESSNLNASQEIYIGTVTQAGEAESLAGGVQEIGEIILEHWCLAKGMPADFYCDLIFGISGAGKVINIKIINGNKSLMYQAHVKNSLSQCIFPKKYYGRTCRVILKP